MRLPKFIRNNPNTSFGVLGLCLAGIGFGILSVLTFPLSGIAVLGGVVGAAAFGIGLLITGSAAINGMFYSRAGERKVDALADKKEKDNENDAGQDLGPNPSLQMKTNAKVKEADVTISMSSTPLLNQGVSTTPPHTNASHTKMSQTSSTRQREGEIDRRSMIRTNQVMAFRRKNRARSIADVGHPVTPSTQSSASSSYGARQAHTAPVPVNPNHPQVIQASSNPIPKSLQKATVTFKSAIENLNQYAPEEGAGRYRPATSLAGRVSYQKVNDHSKTEIVPAQDGKGVGHMTLLVSGKAGANQEEQAMRGFIQDFIKAHSVGVRDGMPLGADGQQLGIVFNRGSQKIREMAARICEEMHLKVLQPSPTLAQGNAQQMQNQSPGLTPGAHAAPTLQGSDNLARAFPAKILHLLETNALLKNSAEMVLGSASEASKEKVANAHLKHFQEALNLYRNNRDDPDIAKKMAEIISKGLREVSESRMNGRKGSGEIIYQPKSDFPSISKEERGDIAKYFAENPEKLEVLCQHQQATLEHAGASVEKGHDSQVPLDNEEASGFRLH